MNVQRTIREFFVVDPLQQYQVRRYWSEPLFLIRLKNLDKILLAVINLPTGTAGTTPIKILGALL